MAGRDQAQTVTPPGKKRGGPIIPGLTTHQDEAVATQLARKAYSRERYEFLLLSLYGLIGILGLSVLANIWLALRPVEIRYFATDSQGQIRELAALDRPIQSKVEVLNWTANAVADAFTFNFANYRQSFEQAKNNFTEPGWKGFQTALASRKILEDITNNKYVSSAAIREAPVVVQEGIADGSRWGWKIEVPLVVTYESASTHTTQTFVAEVVVVRRPESENPRGLGIAQIIAK